MLLLDNLRKRITKDINNSGLEIDMIYFVLKDILNEVTVLYTNTLEQEQKNAAAVQESQKEIQQDKAEVAADSEKGE